MNTGYDNYRPEVHKSEEQWREELTPQEFQVLRKAGTERPYTGQYYDAHTTLSLIHI